MCCCQRGDFGSAVAIPQMWVRRPPRPRSVRGQGQWEQMHRGCRKTPARVRGQSGLASSVPVDKVSREPGREESECPQGEGRREWSEGLKAAWACPLHTRIPPGPRRVCLRIPLTALGCGTQRAGLGSRQQPNVKHAITPSAACLPWARDVTTAQAFNH